MLIYLTKSLYYDDIYLCIPLFFFLNDETVIVVAWHRMPSCIQGRWRMMFGAVPIRVESEEELFRHPHHYTCPESEPQQ